MFSGKQVIRLGDPTSHGGVVVSAAQNFTMFDKNVARIGDVCTCPKKGHNNCVIVEGDPEWTIDGKAVALEGHKTSCGAVLISTLPNVIRSHEGGGAGYFGSSGRGEPTPGRDPQDEQYDEQVGLNIEGNAALAGLPYFIETMDGRSFSGRTTEQGLLPRIDTADEDEYIVYWGDEALAKMDGHSE